MKTAIITGCARGLGNALVHRFASLGYNVIAFLRKENEDFLQFSKCLMADFRVSIIPVYVELEDKDALSRALSYIAELEMPIDTLVNNAAVNISKPAFYMEYEEVEKSFKINYFAPFLIAREIGKIMMRQGYGSIINISSVAAFGSEPGGAAYDASKAALNIFTKSFAQEMAPFGVRVNAVACGVVETDMFLSMKPDVQKKILKRVAMKRPSGLDEVADVITYLASDKATVITGHILRADGGYSL